MEYWIAAYLNFGYVPELVDSISDELWANAGRQRGDDEGDTADALIRRGRDLLLRLFEDVPAGDHVVPITGGLDSRAILGGLLRSVDADRIHTVTFGRPEAIDVEIGRRVARAAGVRWELIDLSTLRWDADRLEAFAFECPRPTQLLDSFVLHQIRARFGPEPTYWYGYMNDVITGGLKPNPPSATWTGARRRFMAYNRLPGADLLNPPGVEPYDLIPDRPFLPPERLRYDDQIDFGLRQNCMIRPHLYGHPHRAVAPFLQRDWVEYNLTMPLRFRSEQWLFRKLMKATFPRLTAQGLKMNWGLSIDAGRWRVLARRAALSARVRVVRAATLRRRGSHPYDKYIDYDLAFRTRPDLREIGHESIRRLKRAGLVDWVDLEKLWERHRRGWINVGHAITLLVGLDHFVRAHEASGRLPWGRPPDWRRP